ncbi:hypothetical protein AVEN_247255-1 [Araneus ventricosus]|uniref:Uncharacterized protein n=1 Tax=Araneus ventricosus TaxID=182803 RepID=A0A4Y2QZN4_ARAVE|nr:hypothetical protein AVEN_247255-1 [Araneus ventricosus]
MWWIPERIKPPENTTNILTGLTLDATSAKIQPEGSDSRGTSCRNNREPVVIILCPAVATESPRTSSTGPLLCPSGKTNPLLDILCHGKAANSPWQAVG